MEKYDCKLSARIYTPEDDGLFPVLVFFHAGGWVLGDLDSYDALCQYLSKHSKRLIISVAYRLAPEYKYPKPLEDAITSIE
jgi:acetyl esterase